MLTAAPSVFARLHYVQIFPLDIGVLAATCMHRITSFIERVGAGCLCWHCPTLQVLTKGQHPHFTVSCTCILFLVIPYSPSKSYTNLLAAPAAYLVLTFTASVSRSKNGGVAGRGNRFFPPVSEGIEGVQNRLSVSRACKYSARYLSHPSPDPQTHSCTSPYPLKHHHNAARHLPPPVN